MEGIAGDSTVEYVREALMRKTEDIRNLVNRFYETTSINPLGLYDVDLFELNTTDKADHVRLLRCKGDQSSEAWPTCFDLHTFSLNEAPAFVALSYSWSAHPWKERQHDSEFPVTVDLAGALVAISSLKCQWLWVDAICINQANVDEKSDQVRRMKRIYERAFKVVVWLGERLAEDLSKMACHDMQEDYAQLLMSAHIHALLHVGRKAWWNRLWIVQELVSSANVLVMIGADARPWDAFVKGMRAIRLDVDALRILPELREVQRLLQAAQEQVKLLHDLRKQFRSNPGAGVELLDILWTTAFSQASDDRDKIYGLLGLTTERDRRTIGIDYFKSRARVMVDTATHFIESKRSLDILSSDWPRYCGRAFNAASDTLPSWTPDFARSPLEHGLSPLRVQRFYASSARHAVLKRIADLFELEFKGIAVGTVEDIMHDCMMLDYNDPLFEDMLDAFRLVTLPALLQFLWSGRLDLRAKFSRSSAIEQICRILTFAEADNRLRTNTTIAFREVMSLLAETDTEVIESVVRILKDRDLYNTSVTLLNEVRATLYKRAIFTTSSGHVGTAAELVQKHDLLIVAFGASTPFLLRSTAYEQKYALVVDSYVDGLMDGAAIRQVDKGELEATWFKLI